MANGLDLLSTYYFHDALMQRKIYQQASTLWGKFIDHLNMENNRLRTLEFPIEIELGFTSDHEKMYFPACEAAIEVLKEKIQIEMKRDCGYLFTIEQNQEDEKWILKCMPAPKQMCLKCNVPLISNGSTSITVKICPNKC